ncbi:hypothetical protein EN850_03010 [Mesorhizobium sp. M8A.F.Ca.ET.207.01.1.1]|uniref:hypothetical protein n=1 Tax=Mesorhizobium sp. M8A.F.Ca.ET.207.01.1.1 TaxID=2563968 RepID=UPI00109C2EA6|nr:hypothetical protein [Mesorhizobium sp. M8A.F.Ca.ET.207.01.1.1]TGQ83728.1 hypothetical protein EN850_03010 [Mesorhizobium sp. M8A.F.Ca.ET.207.01.1.1]
MTELAKIGAEAILAKEAADKAWQDMTNKAMSLADHVGWWKNIARLPSQEDMDGLYRLFDRYEAAQRESDAKRAASFEASNKWAAEANAALAQAGRKF